MQQVLKVVGGVESRGAGGGQEPAAVLRHADHARSR